MKLVLDVKKIRTLREQKVSPWAVILLAYLEQHDKAEWNALPQKEVEESLGIDQSYQSKLLKALTAAGLVATRVRGTGDVRREFKLTGTGTAN